MPTVVCQLWTESEEDWGQRPDGYSLHLNEAQRAAYVKQHNDSLPKDIPSIYVFANGSGYLIDINEDIFKTINQSKNGCRFDGSPPKRK